MQQTTARLFLILILPFLLSIATSAGAAQEVQLKAPSLSKEEIKKYNSPFEHPLMLEQTELARLMASLSYRKTDSPKKNAIFRENIIAAAAPLMRRH